MLFFVINIFSPSICHLSFDFYDDVFCHAGVLYFYEVRFSFMFPGFGDIVRKAFFLLCFFFFFFLKETYNLSFRPRRQSCMNCVAVWLQARCVWLSVEEKK